MQLKRKIVFAYILILLVGSSVAALVLSNGRAVLFALQPLLDREIPMMEAIARLKDATSAIEPLLYEYYATTDRAAFIVRARANETERSVRLDAVESRRPHDPRFPEIRAHIGRLDELRDGLDRVLRVYQAEPVDWDRARELLRESSVTARTVNSLLDDVAEDSRAGMSHAASFAEAKTNETMWVIVATSLILMAAAGGLSVAVHRYLAESAARRRFALFVERNPNPVLSLTEDGSLDTANPSAYALAQFLGQERSGPRSLLPTDLEKCMEEARNAERASVRLLHRSNGRVFSVELHFLAELSRFHAYLLDVTAEQEAHARVEYLAFHDALTGLPNRTSLERDLMDMLARLRASQDCIMLILASVDGWQTLMRTIGTRATDGVAAEVGRRLALATRGGGPFDGLGPYRIEGDTLAVVMKSQHDAEHQRERIAASLQQITAAPLKINEQPLHVSLSGGVADALPGDDVGAITRKATAALSEAKRDGPGTIRMYEAALDAAAMRRAHLQRDLRGAEHRDELSLAYQPQFSLDDLSIVGAEALLRWRHPEHGAVSPIEFIPVAEESLLILPIGRWVMHRAARQAALWRSSGLRGVRVAINVSSRQFTHPDFLADVRSMLRETGVEPADVELEITESIAMSDLEHTVALLGEIRDLGIGLSIDDFGTGFSSLSYLKRMPLDKLKLDQSFVRGIPVNAQDCAISRAVIDLGHQLRLRVVAEGVESDEQLEWLRRHGCDVIQGYLLGRPVQAEEFTGAFAKSLDRRPGTFVPVS